VNPANRSVTVTAVSARHRVGVRLAALAASISLAATCSVVLAAGPALAIGERGTPGDKLSAIETTAIFAGIPLAVAAIIAFLVFLPSIVNGPRYRPGRPWTATTAWFGEPIGSEAAASAITTLPPVTVNGGGASARW
jgi:hypothetical protein